MFPFADDMAERLTLDTMIPRDLWENRPRVDVANQLLELAESGEVELAVTARIREDDPSDPLAVKIDSLPELGIEVTGTVARLGFWQLGRDMLGSEDFEDFRAQLESETGERDLPGWKDWDHLHAHMLIGRDVLRHFLPLDGQLPIQPSGSNLRKRMAFGLQDIEHVDDTETNHTTLLLTVLRLHGSG